MSSKNNNLSETAHTQLPSIKGKKVAIVVSEWNEDITFSLRDGAIATLKDNGILEEDLFVQYVPGAYELPLGARMLLTNEKLDAVICIGCVIKGETMHDEYINHAVAKGIMDLGLTSGKPIIFGVLTPNTKEQALDRAGGKYGNKGVEAATTAIRMIALGTSIEGGKESIGFN